MFVILQYHELAAMANGISLRGEGIMLSCPISYEYVHVFYQQERRLSRWLFCNRPSIYMRHMPLPPIEEKKLAKQSPPP